MKFRIFLYLFIFLFSSLKSQAIPRCEKFYQSIYNDNINTDVFHDTHEDKKVIGIRLEKFWNEKKYDILGLGIADWDYKTDENGYFIVGKLTKDIPAIKVGDVVISINDIDLREVLKENKDSSLEDSKKKLEDSLKSPKPKNLIERDVSDLFDIDEKIRFELKRTEIGKTKIFIVDNIYGFNGGYYWTNTTPDVVIPDDEMIYNTLESYDEPQIDFFINSLTMNEKNGNFQASIETSFLEKLNKKYYITEKVWDDLIFNKVFDNEKLISFRWEYCTFDENQWQKLNTVDPAVGLKFDNLIREDNNIKTSSYTIKPVWSDYRIKGFQQDESLIEYSSTSTYTFNNKFNLKTFPFDKQQIKIYLYNFRHTIPHFKAKVTDYTQKRAIEFKELNNVEGWNITDVKTSYEFFKDPNVFYKHDGVSVIFSLERKSSYYVYKIILPIILILLVCWSSMWINPKEIESRLTITIVCLLSLIAYNFVIDSDLPKLEYLTIMDYIILVSYIFATIPNFITIISFNLLKKNKILASKYEFYGKRIGIPSYLLTILLIILVSTNNSPENTNSMLSWMVN